MDIVLLGHGSRRGKATELGLREVVRRLQNRLNGHCRVRMAGFEFTPPTLEEAVLALAQDGASSIAVMPFFLFDGKHVTVEIPQELERLRHLLPGISLMYARTLGVDPRLVQMIVERAETALAPARGKSKSRGIILVKRGSQPQYDCGESLHQLASQVARAYGVPVEPAQAQFGPPSIEAAAASLARLGVEAIAVVPYLLFPGKVLYDNIQPRCIGAGQAHPHIQFLLTETLGVDDRLIDIAVDRLREAGVPC